MIIPPTSLPPRGGARLVILGTLNRVLPVGRSGSTQGGKNRIDGHRGPFRGSVCNFVDVRGRQIVPLEAFTTWATHASPLHRHPPDKTRYCVPGRSMGAVAFVCGTLIIPPTSLPPRGGAGARLVILGTLNRVSRLGDQGQPKHGDIPPKNSSMGIDMIIPPHLFRRDLVILGPFRQPKGGKTGSTATDIHSAGRHATLSTFAVDKSFR